MESDGLLLASFLAGIIGGALVTGRNEQPAWKGAAAVIAGIAAAYLAIAMFPTAPEVMFPIVNVIGVALAGSALKLPPRLTLGVVVVSALFQIVVGLAAGTLFGVR